MRVSWLLFVAIVVLASACQTVGTNDDPESAQRLLPNIANYDASNADSIVDAVTTAVGGAAALQGNFPAAAALAKVEQTLQCLQDTGTIAANTYIENPPAEVVPKAGIVAVVNQDRLSTNLTACIFSLQRDENLRSQAATIEPCFGDGSLQFRSVNYSYLYAATDPDTCAIFKTHFENVQLNQ